MNNKIDHTKTTIPAAFGFDENLMNDIKGTILTLSSSLMSAEPVRDSVVLHEVFKTLNTKRWSNTDRSEEEKNLEIFITGSIVNTFLEKTKNAIESKMSRASLPEGLMSQLPPQLKEILDKLKAMPGVSVVSEGQIKTPFDKSDDINTESDDFFFKGL